MKYSQFNCPHAQKPAALLLLLIDILLILGIIQNLLKLYCILRAVNYYFFWSSFFFFLCLVTCVWKGCCVSSKPFSLQLLFLSDKLSCQCNSTICNESVKSSVSCTNNSLRNYAFASMLFLHHKMFNTLCPCKNEFSHFSSVALLLLCSNLIMDILN